MLKKRTASEFWLWLQASTYPASLNESVLLAQPNAPNGMQEMQRFAYAKHTCRS